MPFNKEQISLITRVLNGNGITVSHQDSDSAGNLDGDNWLVSVDETWLAAQIASNATARLSDADSDRLSVIERILNISTTASTTPAATSSTKTVTTNLGIAATLSGTLSFTWNIVAGDGVVIHSQPQTITSGASGQVVLRMLAKRLDASIHTSSVSYDPATHSISVGFPSSRSDWTVTFTNVTSSNSVAFTVSN